MNEPPRTTGRLQLILIAAAFVGPLVLAVWLYYQGHDVQPAGRANHGTLLEPIENLRDIVPNSPLHVHNAGLWLLIYEHRGSCNSDCRYALYTIRQSRLMLGREMDRIGRIFLHGESAPDTVFLADEHKGLTALEDSALSQTLKNKKPGELAAGGYYLVDPLGNLVMYFQPEIDPGDMVEDIQRLLKLSHIG